MSDKEYVKFHKLENNSPMFGTYSNNGLKMNKNLGNIDMNLQLFSENDIPKQKSSSLKKGISSFQKRITEHIQKIERPQDFISDWNEKNEDEKEGLIRHRKKEIANFQQSIDERLEELEKRGDTK